MPQPYQTPGVYIVEQRDFPTAVVPVTTAIPAFIGYTQQTISAVSHGQDVTMVPTRITSLKEFEDFFGTGYTQTFTATVILTPPGTLPATPALPTRYAGASYSNSSLPPLPRLSLSMGQYLLTPGDGNTIDTNFFYLYRAVQLFYLNGGSTCYIVSLGRYPEPASGATQPVPLPAATETYQTAIATLEPEPDPTMLLCPDALMYGIDDYHTVMQLMLAHCNKMQNRVALFDVYGGAGAGLLPGTDPSTGPKSPIDEFRNGVGQNYLNYGIAYFPWVNTNLFSASDCTFLNVDAATVTALGKALNNETTPPTMPLVAVPEWGAPVTTPPAPPTTQGIFAEAVALQAWANGTTPLPTIGDETGAALPPAQVALQLQARITAVNKELTAAFPDYALLTTAIASYLNTQPVAPAMAGVFTAVDNTSGVWSAPANISLTAVTSPAVELNDLFQADMNVDAVTGKSVNAIRAFQGRGTVAWGARTLDGNSQDWRYINVRRTLIFIEQSVKLAARSYVFAPNDANTWASVKYLIIDFLASIWSQGALAGAAAADAFSVAVGLGTTMTADDILNGHMNITVLVAVTRPAEFIQLTFRQELQKG